MGENDDEDLVFSIVSYFCFNVVTIYRLSRNNASYYITRYILVTVKTNVTWIFTLVREENEVAINGGNE